VSRVKDDSLRAPFTALEGTTLGEDLPVGEDLAKRIEGLVASGQLAPGSRLPSERDLADMLCVSRLSVSQAIRILVVRGVAESRRGSGTYVTSRALGSPSVPVDVNAGSVDQLAEFRLWLETTGVVQAAMRATAEEVREAESALATIRETAGDVLSWMSADTRFHATLVRSAHNPYLSSVYENVHSSFINRELRRWVRSGEVPGWLAASEGPALYALHEPLLDAVRGHDPEMARIAVMRHHLVMARNLAESSD
jgi:GntR family transcriptional repressor for pyruvate dehydrogenase complex